jgi:hypothetical protein
MKRMLGFALGLAILASGGDALAGWDYEVTGVQVFRYQGTREGESKPVLQEVPATAVHNNERVFVRCTYRKKSEGPMSDWAPFNIDFNVVPGGYLFSKDGSKPDTYRKGEYTIGSDWFLNPEKFPPGSYTLSCHLNFSKDLQEDDYTNNKKSVTVTMIPGGKLTTVDPAGGKISTYSPTLPGKPKQVVAGELVFVGAMPPGKDPKPDLDILRAGAVVKTSCNPSESVVEVQVKVLNRGSGPFPALPGNHVVAVKGVVIGSTLSGGVSIPQLNPGQATDVTVPVRSFSPPVGLAGSKQLLKIDLNTLKWAEESNYGNNNRTLMVVFPAGYCAGKQDPRKPPQSIPPQRAPGPEPRPYSPAPQPPRIPSTR